VLYIVAGEGCPEEFLDPDFLGAITVKGYENNPGEKEVYVEKTFIYERKEVLYGGTIRLKYTTELHRRIARYYLTTVLPEGYIWGVAETYEEYLRQKHDSQNSPWAYIEYYHVASFNYNSLTGEVNEDNSPMSIIKIPD
jgi:hypothetical protein